MVALLLGVQGGDEDAFARLYAATNPVVLRYLRVVTDADPAPLALATWSALVDRLPAFVADEDDDWLEVAVGIAREMALLSAGPSSPAALAEEQARAVSAPARSRPVADPVDEGIAVLRDCGPAVADVLAMGVVAGLGRDSIARITGQGPTDVLALVHEGQARLTVPLQTLVVALRVPGRPAEVADLPSVLPLLAASSRAPLPTAGSTAAPATGDGPAPAAASAPTVAELLTWDSPAPAASTVVHHQRSGHSTPRWARVGASAATWTIALGGLGAAAAMSGLVPGILHSIFGDEGNRPIIAAHGPAQPGQVPPPQGSGTGSEEPSGAQPGGRVPGEPTVQLPGSTGTGDTAVVSAAYLGTGTSTPVLMVPAVFTEPSPGSVTSAPGAAGGTPSTPTSKPPTSGGSTVTAATRTTGKDHVKHSTGQAKGRAKPGHAGTNAAGATAHPQHRATTATSRSMASNTKAASAKAAKAKAAKAKAAKAKAAKAKAAKAKA